VLCTQSVKIDVIGSRLQETKVASVFLNDLKLSHKCKADSELFQTTGAKTLKTRLEQTVLVTGNVKSACNADLSVIVSVTCCNSIIIIMKDNLIREYFYRVLKE